MSVTDEQLARLTADALDRARKAASAALDAVANWSGYEREAAERRLGVTSDPVHDAAVLDDPGYGRALDAFRLAQQLEDLLVPSPRP